MASSQEKVQSRQKPFVERLLPKEGLTLSVQDRFTTPTGFQISYTEPTAFLHKMIASDYPELESSFSGELAIKHCGTGRDIGFYKTGEVGQMTLHEEAIVAERQHSVGMPSGFLAFARIEGEELVKLFPDREPGSETVILMPKFPEGSSIEQMYLNGQVVPGGREEKAVARQLVRRLFAMKRDVEGWEARLYGTMEQGKLLGLVIDDRMHAMESDPVFAEQARFVNAAVEEATSDPVFQDFLLDEVSEGRVGEQHGDPRFNNIFIVNVKNGLEPFIIDAVRLREPRTGTPRMMYEWWITHDYLQLGMMLGKVTATSNARFRGLFHGAMEAYSDDFQPERLFFEDPMHRRLLTVGWIYGLSVDAHVLNYIRRDATDQAVVLKKERQMQPIWDAMVKLAGNPEEGWKEVHGN